MVEECIKQYPKHSYLAEGYMFSRLPREVKFSLTSGTLPMYGRLILDFDQISDRELVISLGIVTDEDIDSTGASLEAELKVVGDIEKYITYGIDSTEFEDLWAEEKET